MTLGVEEDAIARTHLVLQPIALRIMVTPLRPWSGHTRASTRASHTDSHQHSKRKSVIEKKEIKIKGVGGGSAYGSARASDFYPDTAIFRYLCTGTLLRASSDSRAILRGVVGIVGKRGIRVCWFRRVR